MIRRIAAPLLALAWSCAALAADKGAAAPPAPPDLAAIRIALAGTWQSYDDPKFTREFDANGAAADRYEGDSSGTVLGHWMVFLSNAPPRGSDIRNLQPDVVYLRLDENDDQLLFAVTGLSHSDMKMVYLQRGNVLRFMRLK
jgi:hypothetical protein